VLLIYIGDETMRFLLIIILAVINSINLFAEKEWVNVSPPLDEYEDNMGLYCFDDMNCIAFSKFSQYRYILKSNDGGMSWYIFSQVDFYYRDFPRIHPFRTFISDSNHIYTTYYDDITIDKSTDGGLSFTEVNFGEFTEKEGGGFVEFKMYNNRIGVAHTHTNIFITYDNWKNYEVVDVPYDYFLEQPFYFLDSNNIILSNYEESEYNKEYTLRFLQYNISLKEWSVYSNVEKNDPVNGDPKIWEIDVVNDSVIYACGYIELENSWDAEVVWKSIDKGKTWKKVLSNINGYTHYSGLSNISFGNENHGFACTDSGVFYETTDGGESWYLHPYFPEVRGNQPRIVWAGDTPLYKVDQKGIFRLETKSSVTEVRKSENVRVNKSDNSLEIAINDDSFANYNFHLYNISGEIVNTSTLESSMSYIYQTIELPDLINGVYYYVLSSNNSVYYGKLIIID